MNSSDARKAESLLSVSAALALTLGLTLVGCGGKKEDGGGGGGPSRSKEVGCDSASGSYMIYASPPLPEGKDLSPVAQAASDVCNSRKWSPTLRQCLKDAKAKAAIMACFTDPAELTALTDALTKKLAELHPPAAPPPAGDPTPPAPPPAP